MEEYVFYDTKEAWILAIAEAVAKKIQPIEKWKFATEQSHGETDFNKIKENIISEIKDALKKEIPDSLRNEILKLKDPLQTIDIEKWNAIWKGMLYETYPPSFEKVNFHTKKISGINLSFAYLGRVEVESIFADHMCADFSKSILIYTNFCNKNLNNCNFSNATLDHTFFINANLQKANFSNAKLSGTNFEYADLRDADFTGANLEGVNFKKALLTNAKFDYASLFNCEYLQVDDNSVFQTRFSEPLKSLTILWYSIRNIIIKIGVLISVRKAVELTNPIYKADKWTCLREEYTGIKSGLILLFTIFFILPYILKALVLKNIGVLEAKLPISLNAKEYRVWEIILGFDKKDIGYTLLIILLIAYNLLRYMLTMKVNKLKEREIRGQKTPKLKDYEKLFRVHIFVMVLSWLSIAVLLFNIVKLLSGKVYLP